MGPNGTIMGAGDDGKGEVLQSNTSVRSDGMVLDASGKPIGKRNPDGSIRGAGPGDALYTGTTTRPDGTVVGPDGKILGKVRADGMLVGSDGKVVGKMAPDGSVMGTGPSDT